MCGICGELRFDGRAPDLEAVARMVAKLAPRGPDHVGSFSDGPLAFGHTRLAIIDLSFHANQPMVDAETGLALVFNGTIYNYPALREELIARGHHFASHGDTEVILKAYAEWGEACVPRLIGMFAFAIWDERRQRLFLARDRFGIKPLYLSRQHACLRFASDVPALLAGGGVDTAIDPVALHNLFMLHAVVPAPRTILKGATKLPPAHTLTVEADGSEKLNRYWHLDATRPAQPKSDDEWIEAMHDQLRVVVERHKTIADVPVGVLLSGGLDSSLIVGLLAEAGQDKLLTFSIGFEDQPEERGSEFEYSDPVAARFATDHHKLMISNADVLPRLPEAVRHMAEPMFGQDAVAFYLLAEQVSQHVKVVQSGQGADEVFGGYFWYPRMRAAQGSDLERFRMHYFDRDHDEFLDMVTPDYRGADHTASLIAERLAEPGADEYIDRVLRLDTTTLVVEDPVKRVDNMTMAFGLEARVPFLDHELVELAARLPPHLKLGVDNDDAKVVLKRVARGRIPDAVIDRPKGYFPMPVMKYVRGEFLDFMRDILDSQACRERGLFERAYVERVLARPAAHHTRIQGSKLWQLALLELWLQTHVDHS
ncbi:MAG: N-acetylglutaminylglutamine amidotransferase [Zoogloeaceae bacterium]|nr:N-acetylglutaminylglutamine amidotransferase [Gammaproteobacteria bacterium]MCP5230865.1 N-acetylglutaminylglutamine amidotransferase [Zoogloeaceae bacterium]